MYIIVLITCTVINTLLYYMYMYIHVVVLITCTTIHICDELKGYFENAQCLPNLNTQ